MCQKETRIYEPIVVTCTDSAKLEFVSAVALRWAILALGRRATVGNLHIFEFLAGRENEVVGGRIAAWHALKRQDDRLCSTALVHCIQKEASYKRSAGVSSDKKAYKVSFQQRNSDSSNMLNSSWKKMKSRMFLLTRLFKSQVGTPIATSCHCCPVPFGTRHNLVDVYWKKRLSFELLWSWES